MNYNWVFGTMSIYISKFQENMVLNIQVIKSKEKGKYQQSINQVPHMTRDTI